MATSMEIALGHSFFGIQSFFLGSQGDASTQIPWITLTGTGICQTWTHFFTSSFDCVTFEQK